MAIRYDQWVKRPNEELEYSQENIVELHKCTKDVLYFLKYVKIVSLDFGEIFFKPHDYQYELIEKFQKHRFNIALASRQCGKTTIVAAFVLWYAIFNRDKVIGIVSNKESSAKNILARLKRMYESLPVWLKPGVTEYAKTAITFDNGTKIIVSATSADAFRGESINILVCDEFAFVPAHQAEEFWAANYPTISSSKEAKVIIISTPNGMFNIFHRIYTGAELGHNTFEFTKISWERVPGRDDIWAAEQLANLGPQQFAQEFAVEFLGSNNTVIDVEILDHLLGSDIDPISIELDKRLKLYDKPKEDCMYVLGVDPAKGTGENYSVIQILKLNSIDPVSMEQVGVFRDNNTDVYQFSEIIDRLSLIYNRAYIMIENNGEGSAVVSRLWWDFENEGLVNTGSKTVNLGVRSTRSSKQKSVLLMKKLIEDGSIKLVDRNTIEELASFVEEKGKFFGKGRNDDCVSALYWALYILEMGILDTSYKFAENMNHDDAWGILSDVEIDEFWEDDFSWLDNTSVYS